MSNEEKQEAIKLLKATKDILDQCRNSYYIPDVMSVTAIWDDAECDGYCLLEEITELLKRIDKNT